MTLFFANSKIISREKYLNIFQSFLTANILITLLMYLFCPQHVNIRILKIFNLIKEFNPNKQSCIEYARSQLNKVAINNKSKKTIDYIIVEDKRRTGNAIIALNKAIGLCIKTNCSVIFYKNYWFLKKKTQNDLNIKFESIDRLFDPKYDLGHKNFIRGDFYYQHFYDISNFDQIYEILGKSINMNLPKVRIDPNALYIHIRSGDIFRSWPENQYAQPPLCYYTEITNKWNFSNIYLISEDRLNPNIDILIENGATLLIKNLENTIATILSARNVAIGRGTFMVELIKLSEVTKNIWTYDGGILKEHKNTGLSEFGNHVKDLFNMKATDYYRDNILGNRWYNTRKQKKIMVKSQCNSFDKLK